MNAVRGYTLATFVTLTVVALQAGDAPPSRDSLTIPTSDDPDVVGHTVSSSAPSKTTSAKSRSAHSAEFGWSTDYEQALGRAARENKQVLLNFTGSDWCGWCKKLEADVFSKPDFQAHAAERYVLVTVDFPRRKPMSAELREQNARLQRRFGVSGFPTIVVTDASGRKISEIRGYVRGGPKAFFAALERSAPR